MMVTRSVEVFVLSIILLELKFIMKTIITDSSALRTLPEVKMKYRSTKNLSKQVNL